MNLIFYCWKILHLLDYCRHLIPEVLQCIRNTSKTYIQNNIIQKLSSIHQKPNSKYLIDHGMECLTTIDNNITIGILQSEQHVK